MSVTPEAITAELVALPHVRPMAAWGEVAFFVNPGARLKRGAYFATIKTADGAHDRASHLDRAGVWRLNLGLPRRAFEELFGLPPARPAKGGVVAGPWAFETPDTLTPHPVYGWMCWVAILNPGRAAWGRLAPLVGAAHSKALMAAQGRIAREVAHV